MLYAKTQPLYTQAGWDSVIPLEAYTKSPPPEGYTGGDPRLPTLEVYEEWRTEFEDGNLALVVPDGRLGVDIDTYLREDGTKKDGYTQWFEFCNSHGLAVPDDTWISSSRPNPQLAGIRWWTVPKGLEWHSNVPGCDDIELIRPGHRYALVWPSLHKDTGDMYQWYEPGKLDAPSEMLPSPCDFPALDLRLVGALSKGKRGQTSSRPDMADQAVTEWLADRPSGPMCSTMRSLVQYWTARLESESAHQALLGAHLAVVAAASETGCPGVLEALERIQATFYAVSVRRVRPAYQSEYARSLNGAVAEKRKVLRSSCVCDAGTFSLGTRSKPPVEVAEPEQTPAPDAPARQSEPGLLPEEFWTARPALAHVRQAAHSRRRSGEAVLAGLLARFGAMVNPRVKVDTGVGSGPMSLNAFTALVGPAGSGKSASKNIPADLMPTPTLSDFRDREYVGLGSGEGMIEAYLAFRPIETGELDKSGNPKTESRKVQVHENVLFYLDEGESFNTLLNRTGSTLGATIRSAWMGETLGQMNAKQETTRILHGGCYSLGFIVGLQYEACTKLMEDAAYGTPHRFYFSRVTDPNQPNQRAPWPGKLSIDPVQVANTSNGFNVVESISDRLDQRDLARQRGELEVPKLDAHEPVMRAKIATFLAALDGRTLITEEDWELSGHMWKASCEVRDDVLKYLRAKADAEFAQKTKAEVNRSLQISDAQQARAEENSKVELLAKRVAKKVHEKGKVTRRELGQSMNGSQRKYLDQAVALAETRDWIAIGDDDKTLTPGESKPAE